MKENIKIAVLCGGNFAFPALQLLALEKYLAGIAVGGNENQAPTVLYEQCKKSGIPYIHFSSGKNPGQMRDWLDKVRPDAVFSICFPYFLSPQLLDSCPGRFINFHPGPLPEYRGPMPIFEVLRSREKETALSIHIMNEAYDSGPLIIREPVPIATGETFGSLAVKLSECTAQAALSIAQMLQFGTCIPTTEQENDKARYYPKPNQADTCIRWEQMNAEEIIALVNACNPWKQGAAFKAGRRMISITYAALLPGMHENARPGTILELSKENGLSVACIEGRTLRVDTFCSDEGHFPAWKLNDFGLKENMILY